MKTDVYVISVSAHRVDGLPDHYLREREAVITSYDIDKMITKASKGLLITKQDFSNIFTPQKTAQCAPIKLKDSWSETRYYMSFIVRIVESREGQVLSDTTRTIMGWTSSIPTDSGYLPDDAVIHINSICVRKSDQGSVMGGLIISNTNITGLSEDELNLTSRRILLPEYASQQIKYANSFDSTQSLRINIQNLDDEYTFDAKATTSMPLQSTLANTMNEFLYNDFNQVSQNNELDDFIVTINMLSDRTATSGMVKSFTWGVFAMATDWSNRNRIEVDGISSAPSYNPSVTGLQGTMESDDHRTSELAINDVGYPLLVAILPYIQKYGLALLNVRSLWISGTEPVTVVNMARPLDGSILKEQIIRNLEQTFQDIVNNYLQLPHIHAIDLVIDGGFAKPTGILISVNNGYSVPFVVSSAMSSIFAENVYLSTNVLDVLGDAIDSSELNAIHDINEFKQGVKTVTTHTPVVVETIQKPAPVVVETINKSTLFMNPPAVGIVDYDEEEEDEYRPELSDRNRFFGD